MPIYNAVLYDIMMACFSVSATMMLAFTSVSNLLALQGGFQKEGYTNFDI